MHVIYLTKRTQYVNINIKLVNRTIHFKQFFKEQT